MGENVKKMNLIAHYLKMLSINDHLVKIPERGTIAVSGVKDSPMMLRRAFRKKTKE